MTEEMWTSNNPCFTFMVPTIYRCCWVEDTKIVLLWRNVSLILLNAWHVHLTLCVSFWLRKFPFYISANLSTIPIFWYFVINIHSRIFYRSIVLVFHFAQCEIYYAKGCKIGFFSLFCRNYPTLRLYLSLLVCLSTLFSLIVFLHFHFLSSLLQDILLYTYFNFLRLFPIQRSRRSIECATPLFSLHTNTPMIELFNVYPYNYLHLLRI